MPHSNVFTSGIPYTGIAFGPPASADDAATGKFDGDAYIQISGLENFYSPSFTMFFVYEKSGYNNGILFSNYGETSGTKSGFAIGVNSSAQLYVETYNSNGPQIYPLKVNMGSKNAVAISKNFNSLTLDYYNFNTKKSESSSYVTTSDSFLRSDNWYLGSAQNPPTYFDGDNYIGYMDSFVYLTGIIFPFQVDRLFSGYTLLKAPSTYYTVTNESCRYSYSGLTGTIDTITMNTIGSVSYLVQTGYLTNRTGELLALTTGHISGGTGIASGTISGYYNIESGFDNTTYTPFSGTGLEDVISGLRVFEANLSDGSGAYVLFPDSFASGNPIVFTDVVFPSQFAKSEVSNVSSSGFFVDFLPQVSESGILNVFAAPQQRNSELEVGQYNVIINIGHEFIPFTSEFTGIPKLFCNLQNNVDQPLGDYYVSNVTTSGFLLNLIGTVTTPNFKVNYLATTLTSGGLFEIGTTGINNNVASQLISFNSSFASAPIVFGQFINPSGEVDNHYRISPVSSTDFSLTFESNTEPGYQFNYLAWSGTASYVQYLNTTISGIMYLSQAFDEAENLYNLSGYRVVDEIISYDVAISRNVFRSGIIVTPDIGVAIIPTGINVPFSYTIDVNPNQVAEFTHNIYFRNPGFNFLNVNHSLYYTNTGIQDTPFIINKNCNQVLGTRIEPDQYDSGYIFEFGMDGVTYITTQNHTDVSDLITFPESHNKRNINKIGGVNRPSNRYFLDTTYVIDNLNFYENGVAEFGSGLSRSGNQIIVSGDFGISGANILPSDTVSFSDIIVYDNISGVKNYFDSDAILSGSGYHYVKYFDVLHRDLYLNGVKLVSGIDFTRQTVSGMDLFRINSGILYDSGRMFSLPLDLETKNRYTGFFDYQTGERFARGTSMLWANGIRQLLNSEYLEVGQNTLLTGTRSTSSGASIIFNNDNRFWQGF